MRRFKEGEVILLLGAAGGVGTAVAEAAAREGARLHLVDLGTEIDGSGSAPERVEDLASKLRGGGAEASAVALDLRERGAAREAISGCINEYGRLDAIIQCAGAHDDAPIQRLDEEIFGRILDLSVGLAFALIKEGAKAFTEAKRPGSIVLSLGPEALLGAARKAHLAAASGALFGLIRSSAIDLRRWSVRINGVAPTARTRVNEDHPLFRGVSSQSLSAAAVAPLYVYLASSLSEELSGEILGVAGGHIYALSGRESRGVYSEDAHLEIDEIAERIDEITRF